MARIAGVSTATVSRSLSAPSVVAQDTRSRVESAIAQTGYIANSAAQMLRRQEARTVLVAVPDLGNTFFSELISGMEAVARQSGVAVLVADVPRDPSAGKRLVEVLNAGRADGALLLHGAMLPGKGGQWTAVTVCEELSRPTPNTTHVGIDNTAAAREATEHLVERGHRRIVHLAGPANTILTRQRKAGYEVAMRQAGLKATYASGDFSTASGFTAAKAMAQGELPDAVFCANDEMALGLLNGFAAHGVRVPDAVSVIGFDDIAAAPWSHPTLSTVHQPRREMGSLAMERLLSELQGDAPAERIVLPHRVVPRQSVANR
ncbi:MAG: LacI family DNA-binding transcriptional regulator [Pseudomonadota bacterium]